MNNQWKKDQEDLHADVARWSAKQQQEKSGDWFLKGTILLSVVLMMGSGMFCVLNNIDLLLVFILAPISFFCGVLLSTVFGPRCAQWWWNKKYKAAHQTIVAQYNALVRDHQWHHPDLKKIWEDPSQWTVLPPVELNALAEQMATSGVARAQELWMRLLSLNIPVRRIHQRELLHICAKAKAKEKEEQEKQAAEAKNKEEHEVVLAQKEHRAHLLNPQHAWTEEKHGSVAESLLRIQSISPPH